MSKEHKRDGKRKIPQPTLIFQNRSKKEFFDEVSQAPQCSLFSGATSYSSIITSVFIDRRPRPRRELPETFIWGSNTRLRGQG
jgi:hypothetical protein